MPLATDKAIIQTVVDEDLATWLKNRAKADNRSVSSLVGLLLQQAREVTESSKNRPADRFSDK